MPRCSLCNELKVGRGDTLPSATWIATILSSSCRHCQLLVKAVQHVYPLFLSQTQLDGPLQAHIHGKGRIYIYEFLNDFGTHTRVRCSIELFQSMYEDVSEGLPEFVDVPVRGIPVPVPGDRNMWEFLRSSLKTCLQEHQVCKEQQDSGWYPDRLLSVGRDRAGNPMIRLINAQHRHLNSAYIALSHCWGSERFICTTSKNLRDHEIDICYSELPRTFQDAIVVALKMNVAHLWIDSLCIVQDEEDDWARHAEMMDRIYENALFVAAAVSSSASSVPFLGPDAPKSRISHRTVKIEFATTDQLKNYDPVPFIRARALDPPLKPEWIKGPLEDRAWAWQERYCAVRIVSFTDTEAKWHCKMSVGCECLGGLESQKYDQKDLDQDKSVILREWRRVCKEFSSRNLTYDNDRLPALAGIASRFSSLLGSTYVAGHWADELPFDLGWFRTLTNSWIGLPTIYPAKDNGVPTWSWASNSGICSWLWEFHYEREEPSTTTRRRTALDRKSCVEITQISCIPKATNAFGALKAGSFIELRGRVVPATMECDVHGRASVAKEGFKAQLVSLDCKTSSFSTSANGELFQSMRRDTQSTTGRVDEDVAMRNRGTVLCLLLYTGTWNGASEACVLILGKVPGDGKDCYQRLGLGCGRLKCWSGSTYSKRRKWALWRGWDDLEEWQEWERWFVDAEVKTLKIL